MKTLFSVLKTGLQKPVFMVFAVCLALPLLASGQKGNTDFTGKWSFNESKSELPGRGFGIGKALDISQEGNTLTIERTITGRHGEDRSFTGKYYLDGKESDNSFGRRTSKSVVSWSDNGKTMTITTNTKFERNGENFESKSVEVWTLGDGGKTLNIKHSVESPRGERHSTLVYEKD